MKLKKKLIIMSMCILTLALSACGMKEEKTIESMMNEPGFKKALEKQTPEGFTMEASGNTLTYVVKFEDEVEVTDELKDTLKEALNKEESNFTSAGEGLMKEADIKEMKMKIKYVNPDNTEVYTHEYNIKK